MKKCTQCGVELLDEDIYCPNCGAKAPVVIKEEPKPAPVKVEAASSDTSNLGFWDKPFKSLVKGPQVDKKGKPIEPTPMVIMVGVLAMAFASVFLSIGCLEMPAIGALIVIAVIGYVFGVVWNALTFFKRKDKKQSNLMKWLPLGMAGLCLGLAILALFVPARF